MIGKKLLSLALAATYFSVAGCRFACAQDLATIAPTASSHADNDGACHHHAKQQHDAGHGRPAPCCMAHGDNAPGLLPTTITLTKTPILITMIPVAIMNVEVPLAQLRAFSENHDPPQTVSQIVGQSSLSPRAPPSLLAVL